MSCLGLGYLAAWQESLRSVAALTPLTASAHHVPHSSARPRDSWFSGSAHTGLSVHWLESGDRYRHWTSFPLTYHTHARLARFLQTPSSLWPSLDLKWDPGNFASGKWHILPWEPAMLRRSAANQIQIAGLIHGQCLVHVAVGIHVGRHRPTQGQTLAEK